jgi:hypothetical protein
VSFSLKSIKSKNRSLVQFGVAHRPVQTQITSNEQFIAHQEDNVQSSSFCIPANAAVFIVPSAELGCGIYRLKMSLLFIALAPSTVGAF